MLIDIAGIKIMKTLKDLSGIIIEIQDRISSSYVECFTVTSSILLSNNKKYIIFIIIKIIKI